MGELGAALQDCEAAADSVVAEVEPLERRQLWKPLQWGQSNIDETEWLEAGVLLVQALYLRGARVVQNQLLDLPKKEVDLYLYEEATYY